MRQSGLHPKSKRLVVRVCLERVQPHELMRTALEALHLSRELRGVATVPTVGEQDDDRASADAAAVLTVERSERLAYAGAAGQSFAAAAARSRARSGSRPASSAVTRVSRVPNTNASTRLRAATHACMYWSSMRA